MTAMLMEICLVRGNELLNYVEPDKKIAQKWALLNYVDSIILR